MRLGLHYWNYSIPSDPPRIASTLSETARIAEQAESYPDDIDGRSVSSSFLHPGSVSIFDSHGFVRTRRLGRHHWVVTRAVR